jgi:hypothetical protein
LSGTQLMTCQERAPVFGMARTTKDIGEDKRKRSLIKLIMRNVGYGPDYPHWFLYATRNISPSDTKRLDSWKLGYLINTKC